MNSSSTTLAKETQEKSLINQDFDRKAYRIVKELQTDSLVVEEVKLERRGQPLDRYFFRNFGLYVKEVWFMFIHAFVRCIKTYTNFRNFVPNVKRKWQSFCRFWSENWKPLVFVSRLGEFWVDFTNWVRTPRDGTSQKRRFFSFYLFSTLFLIVFGILYATTPKGGIDPITGMYIQVSFLEHNAWLFSITVVVCVVGFLQSAFGINNIYKRYLNTVKRYPLSMSIILLAVCCALFFACRTPFLNACGVSNDTSSLNYYLATAGWGLICIAIYLILFLDGLYNIIARFFFVKGVDGSVTLVRNLKGWIYLLPALIPLFFFTFIPMINALLMGFVSLGGDFVYTQWTLFGFLKRLITNQDNFIQNHMTLEFFKVTFEDPAFLHSLITTTIIAVVTVPICTAIAIFIAVFLNSIKKFQSVFQTIYFLPYVTSMTAITAVWRLLLADTGAINTIFGANLSWLYAVDPIVTVGPSSFLGFSGGTSYYLYSSWAYKIYPQMFGYIIYSIWNGLAFKIVIFLSGLQSIDKQIYQAAELDGASSARKFMKITVPLLGPILLFNTLTSLIGAFKVYTATKTLFLDSPRFETIVYYLFSFINRTQYDRGSAVADLLFILLLCFTLIRMFISKKTNIRMSKEDKKLAKEKAKNQKKMSRADRILSGGAK